MSDLRLQKTVGMAELIDVEVPDRYLTVPPSIRQGPPLNVGSAYLQLANAIKGGRAASPDFDAAVMRHKTLDRVEEAARTGRVIGCSLLRQMGEGTGREREGENR